MEIRDVPTFLAYLDSAHGRTRRVIQCIPPTDIDWAPAPGKFSFGDLVRHLACIERDMYAETVQGKSSRYAGCGRELADGFDAVLAHQSPHGSGCAPCSSMKHIIAVRST